MGFQPARIVAVELDDGLWALGRILWVRLGPPRPIFVEDQRGRVARRLCYDTHIPGDGWLTIIPQNGVELLSPEDRVAQEPPPNDTAEAWKARTEAEHVAWMEERCRS